MQTNGLTYMHTPGLRTSRLQEKGSTEDGSTSKQRRADREHARCALECQWGWRCDGGVAAETSGWCGDASNSGHRGSDNHAVGLSLVDGGRSDNCGRHGHSGCG